ncbi:hypothetical protein HMI54_000448 [Coelomomyces lativittatus]|nr:hypothetical protein HMI54_000448 [Coelomomyces lativittatus]KAJ1513386.1 hypothetical protein HMI56_002541 [Coelomomyces lativittatus]KAJ1517917.1 hypothetical protein HMI55_004913 [Coelomomyces lativittatus]
MSDVETSILDNNEVFDPSLMKKKKKKPKKTLTNDDFVQHADPTETGFQKGEGGEKADEEEEENLDFSKLKKKKKKKAAMDLLDEEINALVVNPTTGEGEVPLSNLHDDVENDDLVFANEGEAPEDPWINSDRDYTYSELLNRVFRILHEHNPALAGGRKRYTMVPPQVAREGSKKTAFANIADICSRMKRNIEHVIQFMYAELGTSGSVDGSQRLIIKGRFQPKQIENVLRRYIVEYVTCKTCKSPDTSLRKENRLYFMQCDSCGSSRSVSAIKTGFQAQTGSRRAAKAKAA